MLTRRIAASACALALVAPAAAVAHPADNGPAANRTAANRTGVVYGSTQYDLQNQKDLWGALETVPTTAVPGDTAAPGHQKYDLPSAVKNVPVTAVPGDTVAPGQQKYDLPTAAPKATPVASTNDGSDGWQIAAIAEAGVLAALAFGSVALVRARRRSPLGA